MIRCRRLAPGESHQDGEGDLDPLVLRIRRLALHRGYDRSELMSPLLQRLMSLRRPSGDSVVEVANLRRRLSAAGLDAKSVAYLMASVEEEPDLARLRLT